MFCIFYIVVLLGFLKVIICYHLSPKEDLMRVLHECSLYRRDVDKDKSRDDQNGRA